MLHKRFESRDPNKDIHAKMFITVFTHLYRSQKAETTHTAIRR